MAIQIKEPKITDQFFIQVSEKIRKVAHQFGKEGKRVIIKTRTYNDCRSLDEVKFKIYSFRLQDGKSEQEALYDAETEAEEIWGYVKEYLLQNKKDGEHVSV